jgi:hypothetical protein
VRRFSEREGSLSCAISQRSPQVQLNQTVVKTLFDFPLRARNEASTHTHSWKPPPLLVDARLLESADILVGKENFRAALSVVDPIFNATHCTNPDLNNLIYGPMLCCGTWMSWIVRCRSFESG